MRFDDCEMRPGVVLSVEDNFGTIKASCAGIFADSEDPVNLPPVYPWFKTSTSTFSTPHINDNIWVIFNRTNPQELFYMFQGPVISSDNEIIKDSVEADVIINKKSGMSNAQLSYTEESGFLMKNDSAELNIDADKNISISREGDNRAIEIDGNAVHIGAGAGEQPAILGNNLVSLLTTLANDLNTLKTTAESNPHTSILAGPIQIMIQNLRKNIKTIKSDNVTLS